MLVSRHDRQPGLGRIGDHRAATAHVATGGGTGSGMAAVDPAEDRPVARRLDPGRGDAVPDGVQAARRVDHRGASAGGTSLRGHSSAERHQRQGAWGFRNRRGEFEARPDCLQTLGSAYRHLLRLDLQNDEPADPAAFERRRRRAPRLGRRRWRDAAPSWTTIPVRRGSGGGVGGTRPASGGGGRRVVLNSGRSSNVPTHSRRCSPFCRQSRCLGDAMNQHRRDPDGSQAAVERRAGQ